MPISHTVEPGDTVVSLADKHGLYAVTIWDHPSNSKVRELRTDMSVLMPGDVVTIPDKRVKFEKRPTGKKHVFRRKGIPAILKLQLFRMHIPRAKQKYCLTVEGVEKKGTTDDMGILQEYVPAQATDAELVIGDDECRISLRFGQLDPLNEIAGVQKRLNNLGYDCGPPDNRLNDATKAALTMFQRDHGLRQSGEIDADTKQKLNEVHDKPYRYPESAPASPGGAG